jgi:cephalosporin-C deacetylase-like acetyl esterase
LKVPGAGVRAYYGDTALAKKGIVTFEIGIHGVTVTQPNIFYYDLAFGPLYQYYFFNLDSRDNYYYKRVYLGCLRAVDLLTSLPEVDTSRIAVYGGSQGGALSIVTAALDKRVKYVQVD